MGWRGREREKKLRYFLFTSFYSPFCDVPNEKDSGDSKIFFHDVETHGCPPLGVIAMEGSENKEDGVFCGLVRINISVRNVIRRHCG